MRRLLVRAGLVVRGNGERGQEAFGLTKRERDTLTLLADGAGQKAIAGELVHSRAEAVAVAHRVGLARPLV